MISQHGNRLVSPLLTASAVIPVMPACMLMEPNPCCRNEWPVHCDEGIHSVWPFKLGAGLAVVIAFAITGHIPRKQNKAEQQHYYLLPHNVPPILFRGATKCWPWKASPAGSNFRCAAVRSAMASRQMRTIKNRSVGKD